MTPIEGLDQEQVPGAGEPAPGSAEAAAADRDAPTLTRDERKLKEEVAELYTTLGMMVVAPIDGLAGRLVVTNADDLAEQWVKLARTQPSVKRVLKKLVEAGGWSGVILAHAMIAVPVLANRGLLPDQAAVPVATMTMMNDPDSVRLFTHDRWRRVGLIVDPDPTAPPRQEGDERGPGAEANGAG